MSNNSNSKCQLFQLHIDAYLDDELESARATEFDDHLADCENCRAELAYAERLHHEVVDLPILDCSDQALEPVDRLFRNAESGSSVGVSSFGQRLNEFLSGLPALVRYGVPVTLAVVIIIGMDGRFLGSQQENGLAINTPPELVLEAQYSQEEIVQALQDLEVAIEYLGQISQRTNVMIEDRFVRRALEDSIRASFRSDNVEEPNEEISNGPI